MLDYLIGTITHVQHDRLTLDVAGFGFKVLMPQKELATLHASKNQAKLFVSLVIREFSQTLYGFKTENERDLFERLMDVTGVGPKLALSIIGNITFSELQQALVAKDTEPLCRIPGIGKKTAERLLIELKDTLPKLIDLTIIEKPGNTSISSDAVRALINLGYTQQVAQRAVKKSIEEESIQDLPSLITVALKHT